MKISNKFLQNSVPTALNWRLMLAQAGMLMTWAMVPIWLKLPNAPLPFTATYVTGFAIILPILWSIFWWVLSGFHGLRNFLQSPTRIIWATALGMLTLWAFLSQFWAFVRVDHPGVAQNAALQIALVFTFTLAMTCAGPPPRAIITTWILSALANSLIGGIQVALQGSIGLLGEFVLGPNQPGISVIQNGDLRWLRAYGLTAHPNILAGFLAVGLLATGAWILSQQRRQSFAGLIILGIGFWVFLLTFSRGAWIAFAAGGVVIAPVLLRRHWPQPETRRMILWTISLLIMLGIAFVLIYWPLLASRVGIDVESIEMRSIADRIVFTDIAMLAIAEHPINGLGGGNFPWYASHYLHYKTDYDLRGDNVHNIILMILTEYGGVGLALFSIMMVSGIWASIKQIKSTQNPTSHLILFGGVVVLFIAGLFDHYPWTLFHGQLLWFGLMAAVIKPANPV